MAGLVLALILGGIVQALSVYLQTLGRTYNDDPLVFALLQGGAAVIMLALIGLKRLDGVGLTPVGLSIISIFLIFTAIVAIYLDIQFPVSEEIIQENTNTFYLVFDKGFVSSKFADIVFQFSAIMAIYFFIRQFSDGYMIVSIIFSSIFLITHLFLLPLQGSVSLYHFLGAMVAGFVFPALLMFTPSPAVYIICLHWSFYLLARLLVPPLLASGNS